MATLALMIGGAILNASAFIGGSYLARSFGGKTSDAEKKRHDLALEKYQTDYASYQKKKQAFEEWVIERQEEKGNAAYEFNTTDEALKYYNKTHQDFNDADHPDFSDYYQPSKEQKTGEMIYVGGGMLTLGYLANKWF